MAQLSRTSDPEVENGNIIDADDLDSEFDNLIAGHNAVDTEVTAIGTGTYTFSGAKTFTTAPKTNQIDERTADSGVTVDSVRCKDGMVKVSGVPTQAGEIGYGSNLLKFHNGTTVIDLGSTITAVNARSSNTILAAADNGAVFVCTSSFTQTLTAAATLGAKWFCYIRNDGSGTITIDPNGAETIDGQTTINVLPTESFMIVCDGTNFKTVGRRPYYEPSGQTITSAGALSLTHNLGRQPRQIFLYLKNTSAELGYSVNDEVLINPQQSNSTAYGISVVATSTTIELRFGSNSSAFYLNDKSSGVLGGIDNSKWLLIVRAFA